MELKPSHALQLFSRVEDPLTEGARDRTSSLPFTEATVNIPCEEDATCDVLGCICEER